MNSVIRRVVPVALVACIAGGWLTPPARAEDKSATIVTPKTAAAHVGEKITAELTVSNVKYSERRMTHFLISGANFRGKESLSVAIREADAEKFKEAGGADFATKFVGQKLRVRGQLIEDEGQLLVFISSPADIEQLGAPQALPPSATELVVMTQTGERNSFPLPLDKDLPRREVTYEHEGEKEVYSGVPISAILEKAGVPLGAEARGANASRYVLFTATDDYVGLLAIAEIDPFMTDEVPLLAETMDGKPMSAFFGSARLVVPGDKRRRRWVYRLSKIEVRSPVEAEKK